MGMRHNRECQSWSCSRNSGDSVPALAELKLPFEATSAPRGGGETYNGLRQHARCLIQSSDNRLNSNVQAFGNHRQVGGGGPYSFMWDNFFFACYITPYNLTLTCIREALGSRSTSSPCVTRPKGTSGPVAVVSGTLCAGEVLPGKAYA